MREEVEAREEDDELRLRGDFGVVGSWKREGR